VSLSGAERAALEKSHALIRLLTLMSTGSSNLSHAAEKLLISATCLILNACHAASPNCVNWSLPVSFSAVNRCFVHSRLQVSREWHCCGLQTLAVCSVAAVAKQFDTQLFPRSFGRFDGGAFPGVHRSHLRVVFALWFPYSGDTPHDIVTFAVAAWMQR
jgi:hypothetical protein